MIKITLSQQIQNTIDNRDASLMVTNVGTRFVLFDRDGNVIETTPTGRTKTYKNHAIAFARALEIIKGRKS